MPSHSVLGVPVVVLSKIGTIELDMVDEVTITQDNLVTQHPTESGAALSDHIVVLPVSIRLSGRFVDTPLPGAISINTLTAFAPQASVVSAGVAAAGLIADALSGDVKGRSVKMWHALEQMRKRKELVTVNVQQNTYPNMAIKNLTGPRSVGDGGSQRFQIELLEIVTAFTLLSSAELVVDDVVGHSAGSVQDQGVQSTTAFME